MKKTFKILAIISLISFSLLLGKTIHAEAFLQKFDGVITSNTKTKTDATQTQDITAKIKTSNGESTVNIKITEPLNSAGVTYNTGEKIIVGQVDINNQAQYVIIDHNRTPAIKILLLIFILCVLLVTKKWGLYSLIGLAYSFTIIIEYILPKIFEGYDPILVALSGALLIAPVTFVLSHGLNRKTATAIAGTFIALSVTGALSIIFSKLMYITGYGSEEALFVQLSKNNELNMQGIYLAGIIIGTLGILDDVTISQAGIVNQLKSVKQDLSPLQLYKNAMAVGHDHISSAVNTLILVYTGSAMPLMLLFINSSESITSIFNSQIIAEELLRTLVGSIGLVLAVPITTILAAYTIKAGVESNKPAHKH